VVSIERTVVVVLRARVVVLGAGGIERTVVVGGSAVLGHLSVLRSSEFCRGPPDEIFGCWVGKFLRAEKKVGFVSAAPPRRCRRAPIIFPKLCKTSIAALAGVMLLTLPTFYDMHKYSTRWKFNEYLTQPNPRNNPCLVRKPLLVPCRIISLGIAL